MKKECTPDEQPTSIIPAGQTTGQSVGAHLSSLNDLNLFLASLSIGMGVVRRVLCPAFFSFYIPDASSFYHSIGATRSQK